MPPSKLKYLAKEDGSAALVYSFQVNNQEFGTWYEAFVDAHSGELLSVVDFLSESSVRCISISSSFPGNEILAVPGASHNEEDPPRGIRGAR
jgi:extracellular elastinolytic metalloproteinase